jgi:hypothetical protein
MLEQLGSLIQHLAEDPQDPKNPRLLIVLAIRMNDITKVAGEFGKFKDLALQSVGQLYGERVDNLMDGYFRHIIEWANVHAENIALFIVRGDMQEDFWIHFFTNTWAQGTEIMLQEVLKCANSFLKDVNKMITDEKFFGKVAEALYSLIISAYIERLVIAINFRYKLKLPLVKPILTSVYEDALLSKTDKKKRILKTDLIDFYSKSIDQEVFEYI